MWNGDPNAKNPNAPEPPKIVVKVVPPPVKTKAEIDKEKAEQWIEKAKQEGRWPPIDVPDFVKPYIEAVDHALFPALFPPKPPTVAEKKAADVKVVIDHKKKK